MKKYKIGYTTGTFDMFHIGHLNILKQAKEQCEYLIVAVSTDELVESYKHKRPIIPFEDRVEILKAIKYVDKVIAQEDMDKLKIIKEIKAEAFFVGNDWQGTPKWNKHEIEFKEVGCEVVWFKYTDGISSTILRERLNEEK